MRNNINFENARLIESLDYIDRDLIAEVIDEIKAPDMKQSPERDGNATRRSVRYALTLAACMLLLGAIIPIVTYVSRHFDLFLSGFSGETTTSDTVNNIEIPSEHEENAPYPIFTPELEPISAEMIAKVKEAYYQKIYDFQYDAWEGYYASGPYSDDYKKENTDLSAKRHAKKYTNGLFSTKKEDHFSGRYYGTIGNCVIIAINTYLEGEYNVITVGNTKIENDNSFYILAYQNGEIKPLEGAYKAEWLTDNNIQKIKERHEQFNAFAYWVDNTKPTYTYATFTPDLEEISYETIEKINNTIFADRFKEYFSYSVENDRIYKILYNNQRITRELCAQESYTSAKNASDVFIKEDRETLKSYEESFRYYGTFDGKAIWAYISMLTSITEFTLDGYNFNYSTSASHYVYVNGEVMDLVAAHKEGLLSKDDVKKLYQRYVAYNEYLASPNRQPVEIKPIVPDSKILAYPHDMSADEIYADVMNGEWVVIKEGNIEKGLELWNDFYEKVSQGKEASVLIASYSPSLYQNDPIIFLKEVRFNGSSCVYLLDMYPSADDSFSETEYKYVVKYEREKEDVYVLVNKDTYTYEQLEKAFSSSLSSDIIRFEWLIKIPK